jgi:hypothetical protein
MIAKAEDEFRPAVLCELDGSDLAFTYYKEIFPDDHLTRLDSEFNDVSGWSSCEFEDLENGIQIQYTAITESQHLVCATVIEEACLIGIIPDDVCPCLYYEGPEPTYPIWVSEILLSPQCLLLVSLYFTAAASKQQQQQEQQQQLNYPYLLIHSFHSECLYRKSRSGHCILRT